MTGEALTVNGEARTATGAALTVKGLSVRYRKTDPASPPALEKINFSLAPGEIMGIIGESGAGKTTLGLSLMKLHPPGLVQVEGEILFRGNNLLDLNEPEMNRLRGSGIGMIFQDARGSLDPALPVIRQVARSISHHRGKPKNDAMETAGATLSEMGVSPEILREAPFPHQLSGGLCQRAAIAAALACQPTILIADEPTSSLDTVSQARIVNLLQRERKARGLSIILISHDLPLVASAADNILVLSHGRVVEQGPARSIIETPQSDYTQSLLSSWRHLIA